MRVRKEPVAEVVEEPVAEVVDDPRMALMERLMELDRERRRLRDWMDAEDSGETIEPPIDWSVARLTGRAEEHDPGGEG